MISQTVNGLNMAEHLGKTPEQLLLLFNFPFALPLTSRVLAEGNKWEKGLLSGQVYPCPGWRSYTALRMRSQTSDVFAPVSFNEKETYSPLTVLQAHVALGLCENSCFVAVCYFHD